MASVLVAIKFGDEQWTFECAVNITADAVLRVFAARWIQEHGFAIEGLSLCYRNGVAIPATSLVETFASRLEPNTADGVLQVLGPTRPLLVRMGIVDQIHAIEFWTTTNAVLKRAKRQWAERYESIEQRLEALLAPDERAAPLYAWQWPDAPIAAQLVPIPLAEQRVAMSRDTARRVVTPTQDYWAISYDLLERVRTVRPKFQSQTETQALLRELHLLRAATDPLVRLFVRYVEQECEPILRPIAEARARGCMTYAGLFLHFLDGQHVVCQVHDQPFGFAVTGCSYERDEFRLHGDAWRASNGKLGSVGFAAHIPYFPDERPIDELPIHVMLDVERTALAARGKRMIALAKGYHHLRYGGFQYEVPDLGTVAADGECVIDFVEYYRERAVGGLDKTVHQIEQLEFCWPLVKGYSLETRMWGDFAITQLEPVRFETDAFAQVLLPAALREKLLVAARDVPMRDIVPAKGRGVNILLKGDPGTGKTVTAEALAATLQRPLIIMSMATIGTALGKVEERLRRFFALGRVWNAVMLLDEADQCCERRGGDLQRNALVCIMLALLDYQPGLLILTTNRGVELDPAIESRMHLVEAYPPLDDASRELIFAELLRKNGVEPDRFAGLLTGLTRKHPDKYPSLNGRTVRNLVKNALQRASYYGRTLEPTDLQAYFV